MRLVSTSRIFFGGGSRWSLHPLAFECSGPAKPPLRNSSPLRGYEFTAQTRRRPEGRLGTSQVKSQTTSEDWDCYPLPEWTPPVFRISCRNTGGVFSKSLGLPGLSCSRGSLNKCKIEKSLLIQSYGPSFLVSSFPHARL